MELIAEIYDSDINKNVKKDTYMNIDYKIRKAGRAILVKDGKIAMLYVSNKKYHKLPGGGVEEGEDIKDALKREILEETGCSAEIKSELGMTIEYRNEFNQLQLSYSYIADVTDSSKEPEFTDDELADGFQIKWIELKDVLDILAEDQPEDYVSKFIHTRDTYIINKYLDKN